MDFGSMEYLLSSEETVVRAKEYISAHYRSKLGVPLLDEECLTFPVVTEAHLSLAESDCILALRHAIEFLQLSLIYTLHSRSARLPLWRTKVQWVDFRGASLPDWGNISQWL